MQVLTDCYGLWIFSQCKHTCWMKNGTRAGLPLAARGHQSITKVCLGFQCEDGQKLLFMAHSSLLTNHFTFSNTTGDRCCLSKQELPLQAPQILYLVSPNQIRSGKHSTQEKKKHAIWAKDGMRNGVSILSWLSPQGLAPVSSVQWSDIVEWSAMLWR